MRLERPTRQAWLVWGCAALIYLAAVFHRGSLGVAGPQALERFAVGPAALSTFTVLQVGIYAAMQIPTGILVDRFGARRVLTAAALLLGFGQVLFAVAESYPLGLTARAVLGIGDALTWVSVLRLVAAYFPPRIYPLVVTFSSALGALGGVAATFPLTILLDQLGWTGTFLLVGAATAGYAAVAATVVRDVPRGEHAPSRPRVGSPAELAHGVRSTWTIPATRLAFWVHFSTMFVMNALTLLWGYPYLIEGLGMRPRLAGVVLSVLIIGQIVGGPIMGTIIGRTPPHRMPIVLTYLVIALLGLALLIAWPGGQPPLPVVVVAFLIFAFGGPVSATAFALVRDYNPRSSVGTATGIANTAGHTATALAVLAMGILLQLTADPTDITDYRIALLAPLTLLLLGLERTTTWWRRTRSVVLAAQERGDEVPVRVRRHRWDRRSTR
ncbi:sugar phosphate permease [Halopolyspora algeriensis]|uniref:Lysosomal dipeptide transporter MFSD1 n=1 Tax=Halopolyspora algeriensis TaxID=1500506 RepID=A0A368W241_9ACTN|nr:MFS transporter [Halopolyspora algeriensis]RCW46048.1 sugar phosphate permease [Halopolyspora algeriensis]TQM55459.1 sugar phosphate permease [Halopolyspora algeriensis]